MNFATFTANITNALQVTGSLRSLINGGFLYLFSGPVPATSDEAIDGASALVMKLSESNDGVTGLTFEATATNGILRKTTSETWSGEVGVGAGGTVTFFRFCVGSDNGEGVAGGTDYRVQGTVGTDMSYGMFLTNNVFADTDQLELDDFQIQQPTTAGLG